MHALETQAWPALMAKTLELTKEANGAAFQLPKFAEDVRELRTDRAAASAAFEKSYRESSTKVDSLRQDAGAVLNILRAEVTDRARPKVNPEREGFVRQDPAALLDHSTDQALDMMSIASGAHRDRAAVIVGDFGDGYLQRLMPDKSTRERFREGLTASMLAGSVKYGTPQEKAAAKAAREVLPKVAGWVACQITPALHRLKAAEASRP